MTNQLIHWDEFTFENDGVKTKYYQLVSRTSYGYLVKKLAPSFYHDLENSCEYYEKIAFSGFLYDEYHRVAGIYIDK